jgi:hypothetical protein
VTRRLQSVVPFFGLTRRAAFTLAALALAFLALAPAASASKQAVDFFGGDGTLGGQFNDPMSVAVNDSGAGPANAGDVYAIDSGSSAISGNRIQRFGRDDNGTPADTADDTYFFISAWGAGVLTGASDYEICTLAAECQQGVASGGNGTAAGNGALDFTSFNAGAIAVDQDTGNVFVTDTDNFRVNVYDGTGVFLRSFGFDVAASGPGDTGTVYEVCVAADGDVCKAGVSGSGVGQIRAGSESAGARGIAVSAPDGNPAGGAVFLADSTNHRVNTYNPDGSSPGSIGSAVEFDEGLDPTSVAVDSRGILYVGARENGSDVERYDTEDANGGGVGFLTPIPAGVDEVQRLTVSATAGTFNLSFDPDGAGPQPSETTIDIPFNWLGGGGTPAAQQAPIDTVQEALHALPSIPPASVRVEGGPGDASGSTPYTIGFGGSVLKGGALAAKDVAQLVAANGAVPLSGGGGASVTTTTPGQPGLLPGVGTQGLAVDPDTDGGGPDADVLYVDRNFGAVLIQQFGPLNAPGLSAPPTDEDDRHGTSRAFSSTRAIAVEPATGRLYAAAFSGLAGRGVYVLDNASPTPPTASLDSVDNVTATSADLHATIDPNGPPATSYRFEYSTDGARWTSLPEEFLGTQADPQAIDREIAPAPIGLAPNTRYHVRLVAGRKLDAPLITNELTFRTDPAPPLVETAGAPVRTTTTAQINGRVVPRNSATTYRFEYGALGPCSANPCASTPTMAAGSDDLAKLVAEEIRGLTPDTTYHYRVIADNGVGSPVPGADMSVRTRASDVLPGQSDAFPGPPGSDRAWEMVSIAESSGNPIAVFYADAFSDDGNRAVYGIAGGTPIAPVGSVVSPHFAERTPAGWQTRAVLPPRDQLVGQLWTPVHGSRDLSTMVMRNRGADLGSENAQTWRITPGASPTLLHQAPGGASEQFGLSADGSRAAAFLPGGLFDVSSGAPQIVSLLPGNLSTPCSMPGPGLGQLSDSHWISEDGSLVYFQTDPTAPCNSEQLYARDLLAGQTRLISGPPLSGPDCGGELVKATPGAAFFTTPSRLDPDDAEPSGCGGAENDVYRYEVADGSLECVTCVAPGFGVDVDGDDPTDVAVAEDGSRLYFTTGKRLAPGTPPEGQRGIYRVNVASGNLAYVAPRSQIGTALTSVALSADGATLVFASDDSSLNPLGGTSDNDGGTQYYRYSDIDRSLICVSCPLDGSPPLDEFDGEFLHKIVGAGFHNNRGLSADGGTLAFATATPLAGADQNTPGSGGNLIAGTDVYEWRDGRHILVTDGLTRWPFAPIVEGVGPTGTDVFFSAPAAYTPDAPDALIRLYTARIGGGIEFPPPGLPPCDLNAGACEGPPSSALDLPGAGGAVFEGPGDPRDPFPRDCSAAAKGAGALSRAARALRRAAKRAGDPRRAQALRRKAARLSAAAKKRRNAARLCRKANSNRRAGG